MPPDISHYTEYPPPGGFSPFVNGIATSSIQVTRFHKWAGSGGHGFLLEAQSINQQQSDHRETNGEPTIPLLWQISSVRIHSPVSRNVEQCICTRQDEATSTLPPFPPPSPPHHRQTWDPAASTLSRLFTGDKIFFPWKFTVRKRRLKQKPSFKTSIKSKLSLVFISRQKTVSKTPRAIFEA